jgi:hypothetical protein
MLALLEIIPTDHKNPFIVRVFVEQFATKPPKIGVGQAIVLQDDPRLFVFKKPIQSRTNRFFAAQIGVSVQSLKVARPINPFGNHLANPLNGFPFFGPAGSWTIASHIKALRPLGPNGFQDFCRGIGAVKNQKKQRRLRSLFLVIHNLSLILR